MKFYVNGNTYGCLPDDTTVVDALPPGYYDVHFGEFTGWRFERRPAIQEAPSMFGPMAGKIDKVIEAFNRRSGSTGILFSGDKGLGKSLMMRHVAQRLALTTPIVVVSTAIPGIAGFLAGITQPVVILLDEFDKNYHDGDDDDDDERKHIGDSQKQFLTLLDGVDGNKRLVLVTCNEVSLMNKYFLNRPGRFYYHFAFQAPTGDEAVAFLRSLGLKGHKDDLDKLSAICEIRNMNYDSLRAIYEELQAGYSVDDTLSDLNIRSNETSYLDAEITVIMNNGDEFNGSINGYNFKDLFNSWVRCFNRTGPKVKDEYPSISFHISPNEVKRTREPRTFQLFPSSKCFIGKREVKPKSIIAVVSKPIERTSPAEFGVYYE